MAVDQNILNGNCLTWNTLVITDMHEQTKWRAPWLIEVERWETPHYPLEVWRGQPINLIQVIYTSEFNDYINLEGNLKKKFPLVAEGS